MSGSEKSSHSPPHNIRLCITGITVMFTLVLSIIFGYASFYFFRSYARSSVLRSSEFNLALVAHLIQQDLIELNNLVSQQALDQKSIEYLTADKLTRQSALDICNNMTVMRRSRSSYMYLQRFIVTDGTNRFVQVADSVANATPLNAYNLSQLPNLDNDSGSVWQYVFHDPLLPDSAPDSLLITQPVYRPRSNERIGTVYLTTSAQLITDRFAGYDTTENGWFYLRTSTGGLWLLNGSHLESASLDIVSTQCDTSTARSASTVIEDVRTADGGNYMLVTCPVGNFGISLTHMLPTSALFAQQTLLWAMIGCIALLALLMGLVLFLYLNRLIMRPIVKLRGRIERIAEGDFSSDASIEWPNELGDVGRGVNQLSHDVQILISKRLADEKERQELEYKMLQNQINPHFIYNTLNSIKWMATLQGSSGIAEMTTAFARLLKSTSKGNRPLNTLREEFSLLNDYCTIQQYRYGGSITIEIADISNENLCECLIPSFSLQPLAENAIFHGIEPKGGVGSIWLHIYQEKNGDVVVAMQDDGVGMDQQTIEAIFSDDEQKDKKFSQIGLRNVHRRIQYAFGYQYGLSIFSELGAYTRVEIRIPPCRKEASR